MHERARVSRQPPLRGAARSEETRAQLHAQDAGHGVVDARHGDCAALDELDGVVDELAPLGGNHEDIDAGVQRLGAAEVAAAGHLADPVPVGHDEPVEAHLPLQDIRDEVAAPVDLALVDVQLLVGPTAERDHHGLCTRAQRAEIALAVDFSQNGLRRRVHSLVPALGGAAVADEVLRGREHASEPAHRAILVLALAGVLEPGHVGRGVRAGDGGILGEPLVRPAPAIVAHYRQGGREGPVLAGDADLLRARTRDPPHQARVVRGAEADVVGEERGAEHVAVPVDRVDPPHDGDLHLAVGRERRVPVGVGEREPGGWRRVLVVVGPRAATVQHRADVILAHLGRGDALDLRLRHLADLLGESHARDHAGDDCLGEGIAPDLAPDPRPVRRSWRQARDLAAARFVVVPGLGPLIARGAHDEDKPDENGRTGRRTPSGRGHA